MRASTLEVVGVTSKEDRWDTSVASRLMTSDPGITSKSMIQNKSAWAYFEANLEQPELPEWHDGVVLVVWNRCHACEEQHRNCLLA